MINNIQIYRESQSAIRKTFYWLYTSFLIYTMETLYTQKWFNFDEGTQNSWNTRLFNKLLGTQVLKPQKKSYQFKTFIKTNFNVGLQKFCRTCTRLHHLRQLEEQYIKSHPYAGWSSWHTKGSRRENIFIRIFNLFTQGLLLQWPKFLFKCK